MADLNSMLARTVPITGASAIRLEASCCPTRSCATRGRLTSVLRSLGVSAVNRVAVMLPNVPAFRSCSSPLGAGRRGAMNPLLKSREIAYYLSDSALRSSLPGPLRPTKLRRSCGDRRAGHRGGRADPGHAAGRPGSAQWQNRPRDDAVVLYTSGTTASPRAPS